MAVNRRMPVEATVEGRRQIARRFDVRIGVEHVPDLVGILAVHTRQRQFRETAGRLGGDVVSHSEYAA